jgi:hybrid cluster-associated redox disulfide protein
MKKAKKQTKISKKKAKINKKMTFAQIMREDPKAAIELSNRGMFCCGCHMAEEETLEQGAEAHGIDADELVEELNKKKR